jgi:hypothetical protein
MTRVTASVVLLASLFVAGLVPSVRADEECSNATLKGSFGVSGSGTFPNGIPFVTIGRFSFDGAGNLTATAILNLSDSTTLRREFTGTYTVDADCTGSAVLVEVGAGGSGGHFDLVIDDDGTEIRLIRTAPGIPGTFTFMGKKQFRGSEKDK